MKLHIIYIPGIGDDVFGQSKAVKTWRLWGVGAELFSMEWGDDRPWDTKFKELLGRIDEIRNTGKDIGLVGASAGASAAINAYAERPDIVGLVSVAGKINLPDKIGDRYRRNNSSFVDSVYQCQESLRKLDAAHRRRILSRHGIVDEVVTPADNFIEGAHNRTSLSFGHFGTIAEQILFGAPGFIRFLKNQQKQARNSL